MKQPILKRAFCYFFSAHFRLTEKVAGGKTARLCYFCFLDSHLFLRSQHSSKDLATVENNSPSVWW